MKQLATLGNTLLLLFCLSACGTSRMATYKSDGPIRNLQMATDKEYGYTQENPIRVGGGSNGPGNERAFLNLLAGPNGEAITYSRLGSCCMFKTKNGLFNDSGMLDKYELKWNGGDESIILFLNMYDYETPMCPVGLTLK